MDITIKAELREGIISYGLYYKIRYKIGKQLFYKDCDTLSIVSMWEDIYSPAEFKGKSIERLSKLTEGEIEQMLIDKVKSYLKQKKIDNSTQSEYDKLFEKYSKLKFKVKI
jgi:hypothetical protein